MLWSRLDGEPARWFDRFEIYRMLGPNRTIEAAYRVALGKISRPGGTWHGAAKRWRWKARAAAWDAQGWQAASAAEELRRRSARERRLLIIAAMREQALSALRRADLAAIEPERARAILSTIRLMLSDSLRQERIEFGEDDAAANQPDLPVPADVDEMIIRIYGEEGDDDGGDGDGGDDDGGDGDDKDGDPGGGAGSQGGEGDRAVG